MPVVIGLKSRLLTVLEATNNQVHTVGMVALLSGFCGFFVGCVRLATWHHAVETAQVVAGIVNYQPHNSFYVYNMKIWSLFIQVCSVMLYSGLSERFVTYFASGLLAMVGFQALSLFAFAFCRNTFLSVAAPWAIVFCLLSGGTEFGLPYLVHIGGCDWSYGSMGLSVICVAIGLQGTGNYRIGGVLLGICPAVHLILGLWAWFLVLTCLLWDLPNEKKQWKKTAPFFLLGCGFSVASLGIHLMMAHEVLGTPSELSAQYVNAFLKYWASHQVPVSTSSLGFWLNLAAVSMSLRWLHSFSHSVPRTSLFVLRALVLAGSFGLAMAAVTWLPDSLVPTILQRIIPGRFLNFVVFSSMAVVIGLLGSQKIWPARILLECLFVGPFLLYLFQPEMGRDVSGHVMVISCVLVSLMPSWTANDRDRQCIHQAAGRACELNNRRFRLAGVGLCVVLTIMTGPYMSSSRRAADMRHADFAVDDWTNDPFYAAIHAVGGMVATSSIGIIQLRTRLPVLMGRDLNMLSYIPECGQDMEGVLRIVYGVDIRNPPKGTYGFDILQVRVYRDTWEARTREEWADIKSRFGLTQVVTFVDWELRLPEIARNKWYKAYVIP